MKDEQHAKALMRVGMTAFRYFGNITAAAEWLEKSNPAHFDGVPPLKYAMQGSPEATRVTFLLERLEQGVYL